MYNNFCVFSIKDNVGKLTYVLSGKNEAANLEESTSKGTYFMKVRRNLENVCQYLGYV